MSKPSFVTQKIFNKNEPVLTTDKPIYIEFSILDLSKHLMYELHYKYFKGKYNANLLFTDTGILVCEIEIKDIYEDFYEDKSLFDFSNYPQDSNFFDPVNKKVINKMKDEFKGTIISEFFGLKSKVYSLNAVDGGEIKKAKRTQ